MHLVIRPSEHTSKARFLKAGGLAVRRSSEGTCARKPARDPPSGPERGQYYKKQVEVPAPENARGQPSPTWRATAVPIARELARLAPAGIGRGG